MNHKNFPSIFVSHGAPDLAIKTIEPAHQFLIKLGRDLTETYGKPKAIVAVSAHWETTIPSVSTAIKPETIYDFGGFQPELYEIVYPADGAPETALRVGELLQKSKMDFAVSDSRGLDHGAWVPLKLMFPGADIPVAQLSIMTRETPAAHFKIGQTLTSLRNENVLILATGSAVHNLSNLRRAKETESWAHEFDRWIYEKLMNGDQESLLNYEKLAPHAELAHPSPEHFLPLFVAMGAGASENGFGKAAILHQSWTYGNLSMASYGFGV